MKAVVYLGNVAGWVEWPGMTVLGKNSNPQCLQATVTRIQGYSFNFKVETCLDFVFLLLHFCTDSQELASLYVLLVLACPQVCCPSRTSKNQSYSFNFNTTNS